MNQKGLVGIIILIALLIIGVGAGAYYLGIKNSSSRQQATPPVYSPSPSPTPTPTPDPTINWQTYTNTKYGYSIKYPADKWTNCHKDEFFLFPGPDNGKYDCYLQQVIPPFNITVNSLGFGYDEVINNVCYSIVSQPVSLSGVSGKKYFASNIIKTPECNGKYPIITVDSASIVLNHNNNKYVIFYNTNPVNQNEHIEQILSTFKFTN